MRWLMILAAGLAVNTARAQNIITEWGGADPNSYDIVQSAGSIVIRAAGGQAFKFYAENPPGTPSTGVINSIIVDPNSTLTGDFTLLIGYPLDPNDPNSAVDPNKPGALHWKAGNLTYPGGTSTILGVHLAGNLCGDGDGHHDNIFCDVINGDIRIESMMGDIVTGSLDKDGSWRSAFAA